MSVVFLVFSVIRLFGLCFIDGRKKERFRIMIKGWAVWFIASAYFGTWVWSGSDIP